MTRRVLVVGGGASGMMAAGRAAEVGAGVVLLEKTPRLGNKLRLTGKGRCNLTNQSELADFIAHFRETGPFLYGAFSRFFVQDLISFFQARGVPTIVERGGRVFPVSNDALQVVDSLEGYLLSTGVSVQRRVPVERIIVQGGQVRGVAAKGRELPAAGVILAAGGASYPKTGSTGDGYRLAAELGHRIIPIRPALVPLIAVDGWVKDLQGVSLRNVQVTVLLENGPLAQETGEMLFTHFGVSGPVILSLSKTAVDAATKGKVSLALNLQPALSAEELDDELRRALGEHGRRQLGGVLADILPAKIAQVITASLRIPPEKPSHQVTAAERHRLTALVRDLRITIKGARPIAEAIVTAGGVDTREVNPRTMESRLVRGLYMCGEVLDIDADTGGYNLQAAFSTGYVAGESAARAVTS